MSQEKLSEDIQQKKAIEQIKENIYVTASAGSGKTRVLTERYIHILEEHNNINIDEIIAITYTENAANEMKERILHKILGKIDKYKNENNKDKLKRWTNIKNRFRFANISTIHSFCAKIIREHPIESAISPDFEIVNGVELILPFTKFVKEHIIELLEKNEPSNVVKSAKNLIRQYDLKQTVEMILTLILDDVKFEKLYRESFENIKDKNEYFNIITEKIERKKREYIDYICSNPKYKEAFDYLINEAIPTMTVVENPKSSDHSLKIRRFVKMLEDVRLGKNIDSVYIPDKWDNKTTGKKFADWERVSKYLTDIFNAIPDIEKGISLNVAGIDKSYELLKDLLSLYEYIKTVFEDSNTILNDDQLNKRRNKALLTFDDLQTIAFILLLNDDYKYIRDEIASEYKYIMVDECQDIDLIQNSLIRLLSFPDTETKPNLFIVGDGKQSIYKFRGADVSTFTQLIGEIDKKKHSNTVTKDDDYSLKTNYRSIKPVVDFTNAFFKMLMIGGSEYFDIEYGDYIKAHRVIQPDYPSVELLLSLEDKQDGDTSDSDNRRFEADLIADRIAQLINGKITQKEVEAGQITILLRSLSASAFYESALSERNIDFQVVKGKGLFTRKEIKDCINLLKVVENERNEIALLSVLRSPFCGVTDLTLLRLTNNLKQTDNDEFSEIVDESTLSSSEDEKPDFKKQIKKIKIYNGLRHYEKYIDDPKEKEKLKFINELLDRLRRNKDRMHISELLRIALDESGYIIAVNGLPKGIQKKENLKKFISFIKTLENSKNFVLYDLIDYIDKTIDILASESDASIPENKNSVKIMTIHRSKGLEFDYVFIPRMDYTEKISYDSILFDEPIIKSKILGEHKPLSFGLAIKCKTEYNKSISPGYDFLKNIDCFKQRKEMRRLLYVAFTRARDHLFITSKCVLDQNKGKTNLKSEPPEKDSEKWVYWLLYFLNLDDEHIGKFYEAYNEELSIKTDCSGNIFKILSIGGVEVKLILKTAHSVIEKKTKPKTILDKEDIDIEPVKSEKLDYVTATSLITYEQCPRKYFYKFVKRIRESSEGLGKRKQDTKSVEYDSIDNSKSEQVNDKETKSSIPLNMIGNIVHGLLEKYEDRRDFLDIISYEINNQRLSILSDEKRKNIVIDHINSLVTDFTKTKIYEEIKQSRIKYPESNFNELNFSIKIDETVIEGAIDKIYRNKDGKLVVLDYKTNRFNKEKNIEKQKEKKAKGYQRQLDVYTLAVSELLDEDVSEAKLYFLDIQDDYTIKRKPNDNENIRESLSETINSIKEKIQAGSCEKTFHTKPSPDCFFCGYWMCEEKNKAINNTNER